ncbi:MAG: hypothetical protein RBR08_14570 [Desulforegulaceae bacterium]|nr:hypothetical protein [Desulforegulaceae bacterium]
MGAKISGYEFKKFYEDPIAWPDGCWHEEAVLKINGEKMDLNIDFIKDTDEIEFIEGVVYTEDDVVSIGTLEESFLKWRNAQDTVFVLVQVDKNLLDSVSAAIRNAGGTIL